MKIGILDVYSIIDAVKEQLKKETALSPALRSSVELLLELTNLLINRVTLNSSNSSKPPSSDPNRKKKSRTGESNKPRGGQNGHKGSNLHPVDDPDEVKPLIIDQRSLPRGHQYHDVGVEKRQVIDLKISRFVIEYRAQILENEEGVQFVADFPEGVTRPVQYGAGVKAHAVYLSQFQLIPYDRIRDQLKEQMHLPVSAGSVFNFNQEAYDALEGFETWVKDQLANEVCANADETGINIDGKGHWLHCLSSPLYTLFYPHQKRGKKAMDEMGVLPRFHGILCHDHWKPYYRYTEFLHALCNAHHLRELERAWEQDGQHWAKEMQDLLLQINKIVEDSGGALSPKEAEPWWKKYRQLLQHAETECPPPDESMRKRKRGRIKRSKARNLLERLRSYEHDVLRFMENPTVPFTNNRGENDIRMTKVHQKISGCFRSMNGAMMFCRIRSYLSTCRKQGVSATEALRVLFQGEYPAFMK